MDLDSIRESLGQLQRDAESATAWKKLGDALEAKLGPSRREAAPLLAAARQTHVDRGEWDAVNQLMQLEIRFSDSDAVKIALWMELARVRGQEQLDEAGAVNAYRKVIEADPSDELAEAAIAESEARRANWQQMVQAYSEEAESAPDDVYKASMLMRVAEAEWRFAGDALNLSRVLGLLAQATEADPKNAMVLQMLERIYRQQGDHRALATVLERWAKNGVEDSAKFAAAIRLARLFLGPLNDPEAAASAYERALSISPGNAEAKEVLVDHYSRVENWDKLVALYERECGPSPGRERAGEMLQIAMLHYRKRNAYSDAAQWFEKLRNAEPTNSAMLAFYRDFSKRSGDEAVLLKALQGAQRALADGAEKQAVTREIAQLAEGQEDAQKAIEQYKALLRQDPSNQEALESLKALYRKTQGYNQLVDILRHELERVPESDRSARLALLREVATIYRDHVPNDTSLVSALNQILQVDDADVAAVRELIRLYEKLGRWRDLLSNQQRLAQMSDNIEEKVSLLRAAARRWLEQFTNVQNATQAFEELLRLAPADREARDTLAELYKKRRAWSALFSLYQSELASLDGAPRLAVMKEMASLASERLAQGPVAATLYKQILELEPSNQLILDALEKQAERSKDWATLADALERRAKLESEPAALITVLQKLGGVYSEQLSDHALATSAWQRVLAVQPGHPRALRVLRDGYLAADDYDGLERLYASHSDYEGLAEVLSNAADRTTNLRTKIDLSYRVAGVFEGRLNQPERAFRAYERILSADPMDARAARALVPLYEADEKWARLPALYELLIEDSSEVSDKYAYYEKLSGISLDRLNDRTAAVEFARKAYECVPQDPQSLELFERVSAECGRFDALAEALEARLRTAAEPDTDAKKAKKGKKGKKAAEAAEPPAEAGPRRALALKLAEIYDVRLGRLPEAIRTLKALLLTAPTDDEIGGRLEQLLRRSGDQDELRWLLGTRVEGATTLERKVALLHEWARIEEEVFEDVARATDLNRRINEFDPQDTEALTDLPRLLLAQGYAEDAVAVIQKHRDSADGPLRASLNEELAEVLLYRLERYDAALAAALEALKLSQDVPRAIEVLQRLVEVESTKRAAAQELAQVYRRTGERRREADAIGVLLSVEGDPALRRALYDRGVEVFEQLDSFNAAFELMLKASRDFPDQLELWDKAHRLASRAGRASELADTYREVLRSRLTPETQRQLCERAAQLHEEQLGDPAGSTPYLEQVLALDPGNHAAFAKLKQILTSNQRWGELQSLYDQTLKAVPEPDAKLELLAEVAMICEEFMEDSKAAISYFEKMLELKADSDPALRALDRLYEKHGRDQQLTELLERRLTLAGRPEASELRLRLARLLLDKLHQPEPALRQVEGVLDEDIGNAAGRELAERILGIGSLKGRAASLLERVYEARDEVRELVRVLEAQLQALRETGASSSGESEVSLLERIASLKNDRLKDDVGALGAFAEYIPLQPSDEHARAQLLEISQRLGAHERAATVLEAAATRAQGNALKSEILMQAGDIREHALRQPELARALYREVLQLEPELPELALPAAHALERIYRHAGEYAELVSVLRFQLTLQADLETRAALLQRIAELSAERLSDLEGAIAAWKLRLDENPGDGVSLHALDNLFERIERYTELAHVLEQRAQLSNQTDERRELLTRLASVFADRLHDRPAAINSYRGLNEEFGPTLGSLSALSSLLEAEARWDEFADALTLYGELAESQEHRLDVLARVGNVRRKHLGNPMGAIDAYREVIAQQAGHLGARAALSELLQSTDGGIRREAAEILSPVLEAEGKHEELLTTLAIVAETTPGIEERLGVLGHAISVADEGLKDPERAFKLASQAVREGAAHTDLRPWLARLERLAVVVGQRREQVELLRQVLPEILDGEISFQVTLSIASLARDELKDRTLALEYFRAAADARADSEETLVALERLYDEAKDYPNLLDILERRADNLADGAERRRLQLWRARVLDENVRDASGAARVLESIIENTLDSTAVSTLEQLYTREGRFEDLIDLYERQIPAGTRDAAELQVLVARVAIGELKDSDRAFDALEGALTRHPQHPGALLELEKLMAEGSSGESRARAAALLEPVYLARADYDRVMRTLEARIGESDPAERRELLQRLAQLNEEQKEDYGAALEVVALLLQDDLTDETTVSELERLAKVGDNRARLAGVYRDVLAAQTNDDASTARLAQRAGELYAELGDAEAALAFFRRALAFEPDSSTLFASVDALLVELDRSEQRVTLYKEALEHRYEPADRVHLLHTLAELYNEKLGLKDQAIVVYVDLLELENDDVGALDTLSRLYYETERFEELYELIRRRAEAATSQTRASAYRLAMSRLCRNEIGDNARAVSQLEEVVQVEPTNPEALKELEELRADPQQRARVVDILRPIYEEADDWKRLIKLNEDRFQLAAMLGDKILVLRETADLWEHRGHDANRALQVLAAAVQLEPEDSELRAEFERLVEVTAAWDRLIEVYGAVLTKHPTLASAQEVWLRVARVHDGPRDDPRAALRAYEHVFELDATDAEPLERMEALATLLSDWETLDRVLVAKTEQVYMDDERASLWRRVGEGRRDMLNRAAGAIDAYEQALSLDPESSFTVDCLIELREAEPKSERLVELYERRVELAEPDDSELCYGLLVKAAQVYESHFNDRSRAIESLSRALEQKPDDLPVLQKLHGLFRAEQRWPALLDNLRSQADIATDVAARANLRREMGDLLAGELGDFEDALRSYEQVIDEVPTDRAAQLSVRKIGETHEELREQVAGILIPALIASGAHAEHAEVLEMRLVVESDHVARAGTLRSISEVHLTKLNDQKSALRALLRAVSEVPEDSALHTEIEQLCASSMGWAEYADILTERTQTTFDAEVARDLLTRLGRVAEFELHDRKRAIDAYVRAVEQVGDEPELLGALDRLYTASELWGQLSEVIERRTMMVETDEQRAELHYRLACLQIDKFSEFGQGLASLRAALDLNPFDEAVSGRLEELTLRRDLFEEASDILEQVYRSRGATARLASLYEKRVGFADSPSQRVEMRKSLARVLQDELHNPAEAQKVLQQGLEDDLGDAELIDEIERLANISADWSSAANALQKALAHEPSITPEVGCELAVRLSRWYGERLGNSDAAEAALVRALAFDPVNDDVLLQLELLQRSQGKELSRIETLRKRARVQFDEVNRDELYREAATIAQQLGNAAVAEAVAKELLERAPDSFWALSLVAELREQAGDYVETFALLLRMSQVAEDAQIGAELQHRAAAIARDKLDEPRKAVEIYERLLEEDPLDHTASGALRALYAKSGQYQPLAKLIERMIELEDNVSGQSALRMELAQLEREQFKNPTAAIEQLRTILYDEPTHSDAVLALSRLYEELGDDEELASLLLDQVTAAEKRGDKTAQLRLQLRLAEIYESRLKDNGRARDAYLGLLAFDPDNAIALGALARLCRGDSEHDQAAEFLERLVDLCSGADRVAAATELAATYEVIGNRAGATRAIERALAVTPSAEPLREKLRSLYRQENSWARLAAMMAEDAERTSDEATQVSLLRDAASILTDKQHSPELAIELLERANRKRPEDRALLLQLCDTYELAGKPQLVVGALERIVESFGGKRSRELADIHRRLASAFHAEGQIERAVAELDKAFRIEPGNIHVLKALGELALEAGDMKRAQQMFRALLLQKLDGPGPISKAEVFYYLGVVHERMDERPKAIQMLERAVQTDAGLAVAQELLTQLQRG